LYWHLDIKPLQFQVTILVGDDDLHRLAAGFDFICHHENLWSVINLEVFPFWHSLILFAKQTENIDNRQKLKDTTSRCSLQYSEVL
jgi:hypothetical protein